MSEGHFNRNRLAFVHTVQLYINHISTCTFINYGLLYTQPRRSWTSLGLSYWRHGMSIYQQGRPGGLIVSVLYQFEFQIPR
jgi:hypothetical protein